MVSRATAATDVKIRWFMIIPSEKSPSDVDGSAAAWPQLLVADA
jgi:hypothetical protein